VAAVARSATFGPVGSSRRWIKGDAVLRVQQRVLHPHAVPSETVAVPPELLADVLDDLHVASNLADPEAGCAFAQRLDGLDRVDPVELARRIARAGQATNGMSYISSCGSAPGHTSSWRRMFIRSILAGRFTPADLLTMLAAWGACP